MSSTAPTTLKDLPPLYTDTPLALLTTPKYETGKTDPYTVEASHMTLSHNSFIRGFNSIYQQAPRIKSVDHKDFVGYCLAWHTCIEAHHHYEETLFFPAIEEAVGEKGIMDGEVEQHASFHDGLESFKAYLLGLANPTDFQPAKLLEIMDSFSQPLYTHLVSEPRSLLALSRFSTREKPIDIAKMALEAGKKSITLGFVLNTLPVYLLNMESVAFEEGMWQNFPPVSKPVKWVMTRAIPLWQWQQWRFASCGSDGRMKHLVA